MGEGGEEFQVGTGDLSSFGSQHIDDFVLSILTWASIFIARRVSTFPVARRNSANAALKVCATLTPRRVRLTELKGPVSGC